jgi:phenylacetate-coenzyme A ligase PaaK-like adenylate-forming protein
MMGAINVGRTFSRKNDMKRFIKEGPKTAGVYADGGFYLGNSSVRSRLLAMPWKKKQMAIINSLDPVDEIVKQLNEFKPTMLGGYPTVLELLIDEKLSGRLTIQPVIIMTGGEYLSESLRNRLSEAFECYTQTSYGCTEGGTIASECIEHHFHINDDWLIVEPVNHNNQPVPDGEMADKILLTNLFNYSQPFIRYEITDRVVMHHERCGCGNPSPWFTIEGRTDDVARFYENGIEIKVPPLSIYATLKEVHELKRFQVIVTDENEVEIRIVPDNQITKEDAFKKADEALRKFLSIHGVVHFQSYLSEEEPKQHPQSGKFKHVIYRKKT